MPKKFEDGGFILKIHQMFSDHITPEEIENTAITSDFGIFFMKMQPGKSHDFVTPLFLTTFRVPTTMRPCGNIEEILCLAKGSSLVWDH